jgi:hypothetical protein
MSMSCSRLTYCMEIYAPTVGVGIGAASRNSASARESISTSLELEILWSAGTSDSGRICAARVLGAQPASSGLLRVRDRFLEGFALGKAARQGWDADTVPPSSGSGCSKTT